MEDMQRLPSDPASDPVLEPPPSLEFVEGRVTEMLPRYFVVENEWGNAVRVSTQVGGRQTGLRVGDRVRVSGGSGAGGVFLCGWATRIDAAGRETDVPVNYDDLRRRATAAGEETHADMFTPGPDMNGADAATPDTLAPEPEGPLTAEWLDSIADAD